MYMYINHVSSNKPVVVLCCVWEAVTEERGLDECGEGEMKG